MGVVVIGAIFVDIKGFPHDVYIPDGRNAGSIEYIHGGVCRNIAEDIANVGYPSTLISLVDRSALGEDVVKHLHCQGVNTEYIRSVDEGMGTWLAVFDEHGDLAGSISQRPHLISILDILNEYGDEIFKDCDAIALEADLEQEILDVVLGYARKYHKKVYAGISNMSIALERLDYFKCFDCFVCNDIEAGQLFEDDYSELDVEELEPLLLKNMHKMHIPAMVVTLGEKGSVFLQGEDYGSVKARCVNVVDTTGAGDAFFSGVVVGMTYKNSLKEGVVLGTDMAASVITSSKNVYRRNDGV